MLGQRSSFVEAAAFVKPKTNQTSCGWCSTTSHKPWSFSSPPARRLSHIQQYLHSNNDHWTPQETIQQSFINHVNKTLARSSFNMDQQAAYQAAALSVRDRLIDEWNTTQQYHSSQDPKRVYYLSLEFLIGRSLDNALLNLNVKDNYASALDKIGFRVEDFISEEVDAALGNGGLGRLAACFMVAQQLIFSVTLQAWGYGIRYTYGIFQQRIVDGYQTEYPDYWLTFGNPWEIQRLDVAYDVNFKGHVEKCIDDNGTEKFTWVPGENVVAVAYDYPIPGFGTKNCINIRLWSSKPKREFDLASFNDGNYDKSVEEQKAAENITSVLYPNDNHMVGKVLRLKQQYFFVCATLQDIIRRFKKSSRPWSEFSDQVAIQLNDTHPTLGIAELQRILVDEENLDWDEAWDIVTKTYSYTNHTVLPEALEKWSVPLMEEYLPRHLAIIFNINLFFLQAVERKYPGDREKLRRMSIIEEGHPQWIRMAHLAAVGSHTVNGVAELHSALVRSNIFPDFVEYYGSEKFVNVTNGVTPRRWLYQSNPLLAKLITKKLGSDAFLKDLSELEKVKAFADDSAFQKEWMDIKRENKVRLAKYIKEHLNVEVNPDALFDVQCKRLHEYKRQFMNILGVIYRYEKLKALPKEELAKTVPHVVIFSGKSAPGYYTAKLIIKLINSVADVINQDPDTSDYLKLIFIPNYCVSIAEFLIPASDISQHISTAGTEASGTSNMKFVLNGGLILGTVDGANIEIGECTGAENIFFFGTLTPAVEDIRHDQMYHQVKMDSKLESVVSSIQSGRYGDAGIFEPLLGKDWAEIDGLYRFGFRNFTESPLTLLNYHHHPSQPLSAPITTSSASTSLLVRFLRPALFFLWRNLPVPVPPV
ncbi:carbohydrate phosphorylase-domain-containing protein [Blyttiomyces helicus]|uniref:Alpha-1,4 glucan phosphorylase n=1 Tax=Blyttiomyces helicus TaxID=388810 RepID=A0A4P9WE78_9FUNG|nr:carbohydrate phosphorylase-domain-containing protein [Blyttiomyces helicus]|eukprot:RKO89280.1 carbohydrate phosphorylase-domain-containing protein [Blyttiomyces helicus]